VGVTLPLNGNPSSQGTVEWKLAPAILPGILQPDISPTTFRSDGSIGDFDIRYIFKDDNGCTDSTITALCVQPEPNAVFTTDTAAGCVPLAVTTQNGSNTLLDTCGITTYNWDVFFDGAECHNDGGMWIFTSGNATSVSPSFEFTKSGIYRLVLTVGNGCGTSTSTQTITVGEAPKELEIDFIDNACESLLLAPTGRAKACNAPGLTLTWRLDSVPFPNPPGLNVTKLGLRTVDLIATNDCGADTISTTFTIHPLPPAPVVSYNGPVCERDILTFTISGSPDPNLQYCWTGPGIPNPPFCTTATTFSIPGAKPEDGGDYTVTVRNLTTECENSTSITAIVNPAPPIQFAADPVRICSGQSGTLSIVNPSTNFTYTWSPSLYLTPTPPTGPVVTVNAPDTLITTSINYTVSVTNTVTTCTNSDIVEVIIDTLPVVSIVPPGMACVGVTLPLNGNPSNQGTAEWAVTPAGPQFLPASTQNPTNFQSGSPGVFDITYIFTDNNGCTDSTDTEICVQPQPNASFGLSQAFGCLKPDAPVLQVSTTNFADTADNCDNNRYEWDVQFLGAECHNGNGMWSFAPGSSTGSVNPVFNFTQSGVYQIELIVRNDCNPDGDSEIIAAERIYF
jgi:PKD repeat protein